MKFFKWIFYLFSPCVNSFERKVNKFFKHIKSTDSISSVRKDLLALMKENLIVVNVWLEKKFKGYTYLKKDVRRKMYEDTKKIVAKLNGHSKKNAVKISLVKGALEDAGLALPDAHNEKIKYLYEIMQFLRPGQYYKYIKTASFGKLLMDPAEKKLEGDCNQIVTLYIYLYSLKFPIEELQIKLLPEHVCLHFNGIDIEATNGTFQKYKDNSDVLPVTEIISTNLLDLLDFREEVQSISPRIIVKSAQLAYAISSLKPLVAKNLNVAYHNLAIGAMKANDFDVAIFYVQKTHDRDLLLKIYHNATLYFMKHNNFGKARFYADKSMDRDLLKIVKHNEGVYYYKKNNIDKALKVFSDLGDEEMKKACYGKQYNELAKRVSGDKTLTQIKKNHDVYQKMLGLAQKMGDSKLASSVRKTLELK